MYQFLYPVCRYSEKRCVTDAKLLRAIKTGLFNNLTNDTSWKLQSKYLKEVSNKKRMCVFVLMPVLPCYGEIV